MGFYLFSDRIFFFLQKSHTLSALFYLLFCKIYTSKTKNPLLKAGETKSILEEKYNLQMLKFYCYLTLYCL